MEKNNSKFWHTYISSLIVLVCLALMAVFNPSEHEMIERVGTSYDVPILGNMFADRTVKVDRHFLYSEAYDFTGEKVATGFCGMIFLTKRSN